MILNSTKAEREAVLSVARLMITATITAPKTGGKDNITTAILTDEDKERIANGLDKIGKEKSPDFFIRDSIKTKLAYL